MEHIGYGMHGSNSAECFHPISTIKFYWKSLSFPGSCSTRLLGTNRKGPSGRGCIEVDIAIFGLWIHDDNDYLFLVYYHFATDTS